MLKLTLKSLMAHKLRLALTALAVVLGVAFMAGTFVLTDTIKHDINGLISSTSAGRSAVVEASSPYEKPGQGDFGAQGNRPLTPESLVSVVLAVPGVAAADGEVQGSVTLARNGKVLKTKGQAPTVAVNWLPDRVLSSLTLRSGHAPDGAAQMIVDAQTAKDDSLQLGDQITVVGNNGPEPFTLVGVVGFGKASTLAGATIAGFETSTAQAVAGKPGFFNGIYVAAASGVSTDSLVSSIGSRLPKGYEAVTEAQVVAQTSATVDKFISTFNTFLLFFAGIALFVGAFLIFNTFSILVGQRTKELALLRAIGASRRQVTRSVLAEATFTGLGGSVVGLLVGIPLAAGMYSLLSSLGLSVPSQGLRIEPRTIIASIVVGTLITVVSVILPARRAGRVPPVAAMRDDVNIEEASLRRRATVGSIVLGLGLLGLLAGLTVSGSAALVGIGAAFTFVGVAMLVPLIAAPLAQFLGAPLAAVQGLPGRLGRENAARNPRRTASTASALMVGLGVVGAIATLASSTSSSFGGIIDRTFNASYVITTSQQYFPTAVEPVLAAAPGVEAYSPYTQLQFHTGTQSDQLTAIDGVTGPKLLNLDLVQGSSAALAQGEVLVDKSVASSNHLKVGDVVPMGFTDTGVKDVKVGGIYKPNPLLGGYLISTQLLSQNVTTRQDEALLVRTSAAGPAEQAALASALKDFPQLSVKTSAQFKSDQKKQINGFLAVVYVLLAISILIALIGVVNTLALSVLERTHEIGLLRAVGMFRRQVRKMIRAEAVIVSLMGALLGLAMGVGLGAAIVSALGGTGVDQLTIPWATIIVVLVLTAIFGVFAAVMPARRAAKLDVLRAVSSS